MGKRMLFDTEARDALRRGFDQLADTVRLTLGPRGRKVVAKDIGERRARRDAGVGGLRLRGDAAPR